MRHPVPAFAAILLLITVLAAASAADPSTTANDPAVQDRATELLDASLAASSASSVIARLRDARSDPTLTAVEQDAVLHVYLRALRPMAPRSIPVAVLHWIQSLPPRAVTGHAEGRHHPVPVFNIAAEARGLLNQWAWQEGHDAVAGPNRLTAERLARVLADTPQDQPRARGMRQGLRRLTGLELDQLSATCAATSTGCGFARADIELLRGNAEWLTAWLTVAPPAVALPRLRAVRQHWSPEAAQALILGAVSHPDPGVAGWAISDISAHLPKDVATRRAWGMRLVNLLADEEKGAAAALQLARLDSADWIEAASARPMGDLARQRLSLVAEAEALLSDESTER